MANRIKELRKAADMTQQQLAEIVDVDTSTISRLETGKRGKGRGGKGGPSFITIKKIADVFGQEPEDIVDQETLEAAKIVLLPSRARDLVIPPAENAAEAMVPVRGVAAGSHHRGAFQLTTDEIDYVPAPAALANERGVFAIYVIGDSMEPEHREGDLRFISPARPARIGDTVVIEAVDDPDEPEWAMIGHLKAKGEEISIEKLNPPAVIRVHKLALKSIYKVLSQRELFGR